MTEFEGRAITKIVKVNAVLPFYGCEKPFGKLISFQRITFIFYNNDSNVPKFVEGPRQARKRRINKDLHQNRKKPRFL